MNPFALIESVSALKLTPEHVLVVKLSEPPSSQEELEAISRVFDQFPWPAGKPGGVLIAPAGIELGASIGGRDQQEINLLIDERKKDLMYSDQGAEEADLDELIALVREDERLRARRLAE